MAERPVWVKSKSPSVWQTISAVRAVKFFSVASARVGRTFFPRNRWSSLNVQPADGFGKDAPPARFVQTAALASWR